MMKMIMEPTSIDDDYDGGNDDIDSDEWLWYTGFIVMWQCW